MIGTKEIYKVGKGKITGCGLYILWILSAEPTFPVAFSVEKWYSMNREWP